MRKVAVLGIVFLLVVSITGCGGNTGKENTAAMGPEMEAYRSYLEERDQVEDLYFSCIPVSEEGVEVLALTYGKNAVKKEKNSITTSHLVLKTYSEGKVLDVEGSNMDSFSNTAAFLAGDGKMWVPVYGGIGVYTVKGTMLTGNVYTKEMETYTTYSVNGKKRSEPEAIDAGTVEKIVETGDSTAKPILFYKNTKGNREKYLK
ncbi:MAG: hypothetical protein J1F22_03730 [Lachnospiraceae bacterium]|nr:hypothetical protein [Lachnospiraceae bacterium]